MKLLPWRWLIGLSVATMVLLGTLRLYQQPNFLVTLADLLWSCF